MGFSGCNTRPTFNIKPKAETATSILRREVIVGFSILVETIYAPKESKEIRTATISLGSNNNTPPHAKYAESIPITVPQTQKIIAVFSIAVTKETIEFLFIMI